MNCRIGAALVWLCLFPGVAGCAPTDIKWTEEVKLHDGKVIQVKRRTELSATGFPTQKRGDARYHELCYPPMVIYWKSKPEYRPETFDIVNGKAYARVPLRGCSTCVLHGYATHADDDGTRDARGLVTLADKERRDASLYYELKVTGAKSTSERPGIRDMCSKCRTVDVKTDATADVFLPSTTKTCNWT